MKLLNIVPVAICMCLFISQAIADPVDNIASPENNSYTCPAPLICPKKKSCLSCPECEVCESPSPSPSASSSPSPSASKPACQYYSLNFSSGSVDREGKLSIDQSTGGAEDLKCFENIVRETFESVVEHDPTHSNLDLEYSADQPFNKEGSELNEEYSGLFTYKLWDNLLAKIGKTRSDHEGNKSFIKCAGGYVAINSEGHSGSLQLGGGTSNGDETPGCISGSIALGADCKMINVADLNNKMKLCGSIDYYSEMHTPVSLIWSDSYKDMPSTLVNFKLNPYSDINTWLWRGSEALPLLVYDPEHTGVITSSTQLFGSWTFGGNGLASLVEGSEHGTPWRDGYEALSKMDKDLDGKVSGAELKDIALWFDKNQDGVSQAGEVKNLSDVSVTALYYQADKMGEGVIIASKGYERVVDGKTILESSMDWRERGLMDGFDILLEGLDKSNESIKPREDNLSDYTKDVVPGISGSWAWSLDLPARGSGFFSFDRTKGRILGASLSQIGISGIEGIASQIMFSHFNATSTMNGQGLTEVKFTVSGAEGAILTNTASLSKDGKSLVGKTVVTKSSLAESGTYEYSWKAERMK